MKPEDLMFGNWVAYKDQPSIPLQVNGISKDKVYLKHSLYWNWNLEKGTYERIERPSEVNYEDLVPIEITPENLEKNGFVNRHTIGELYRCDILLDDEIGGKYISLNYYLYNKCLSIKLAKDYSTCPSVSDLPIQYFHELQNALTLCKIEKQIEP